MHSHDSQPQELQQVIWDRLFEAAHIAAMNKHERQAYIQKMTTERDLRNQLAYAKEQAEAEGRAEGESFAKVEIAKSMKAKGIGIALIAECTNLTIAEIEKL